MEVIKRSLFNASEFDDHKTPHNDVTPGQVAFESIWFVCFFLWIARHFKIIDKDCLDKVNKFFIRNDKVHSHTDEEKLIGKETDSVEAAKADCEISSASSNGHSNEVRNPKDEPQCSKEKTGNKTDAKKVFTPVRPPPSIDEFLKNVVVFGIILYYFYLCDYKKVFPMLERVYNRDVFLFLVFLLFLVGIVFTIRPTTDKILNRDQTEEWKGWMQAMFVWYHVFAATEWYNWIRVYIAAYVWMTGFGNFSFFWVRKDFSLLRFLKMQFRLNFLVTCLCVAVSNEYMLYYICAMHSYWFISVYVFMGVFKSWNSDSKKMAVKFAAYFITNCIIFEIDVVKSNIFRPFSFLLKHSNPRFDPMHEWAFRAGLDHWACFFGMICAYNYPHFESFMINIEKCENLKKKIAVKIAMILASLVVMAAWYTCFMRKDKFEYNNSHPYSSMIPIVCFIIIRNSFPILRKHYIHLFAWLGRITLETYLSQLHIYLQSNAKHFIGYLPVDMPMLNFALATIIYVPISYKLFNITTVFSSYLIPSDIKTVVKNLILILIAFSVPYVSATIVRALAK